MDEHQLDTLFYRPGAGLGLRIEVGDFGQQAAEAGWGESVEEGFEFAFAAPHHDLGGDGASVRALGGRAVGGEPLTDLECHSSQGLKDGGGVRGEHLVPEPEGFGEASGGGRVEGGEDLLLATLADEVGDVAVGDGWAIGDVE